MVWAEAYLHTKWHLDPSNRLANVTDGQDRQGPDSIGWTVLRSPENRDAQKKQSSQKVSEVSPEVGPSEGSLRWERFVKEVGFELEVKERGSY